MSAKQVQCARPSVIDLDTLLSDPVTVALTNQRTKQAIVVFLHFDGIL